MAIAWQLLTQPFRFLAGTQRPSCRQQTSHARHTDERLFLPFTLFGQNTVTLCQHNGFFSRFPVFPQALPSEKNFGLSRPTACADKPGRLSVGGTRATLSSEAVRPTNTPAFLSPAFL